MLNEVPEAAGEVSAIQAAAQALTGAMGEETTPGAGETADEAGTEQQAESSHEQGTDEAEAGAEEAAAKEPKSLPHGVQKRIDKLTDRNREANEELARLKAENAKLAEAAAAREEAQLIERSKEITNALTWMRGNKAGFIAETLKRHPYLSEEQASQMYADRRDELVGEATEMNAKLMQRAITRKSEGTQSVNTTTTRPAAQQLQQKLKPKPTSIVPGGATGGGSAVRNAGQGPVTMNRIAERAKQLGGHEDAMIDAAAEALGDIPYEAEARKLDRAVMLRGGQI